MAHDIWNVDDERAQVLLSDGDVGRHHVHTVGRQVVVNDCHHYTSIVLPTGRVSAVAHGIRCRQRVVSAKA